MGAFFAHSLPHKQYHSRSFVDGCHLTSYLIIHALRFARSARAWSVAGSLPEANAHSVRSMPVGEDSPTAAAYVHCPGHNKKGPKASSAVSEQHLLPLECHAEGCCRVAELAVIPPWIVFLTIFSRSGL